jgi:carbon monoxide dehydrogenase subunit G
MDLTNEFRVPVPPERAWAILTDIERIAPCMPGAQLQEVDGDDFRGIVKVKVGPITAQYKGTATFVERDEAGRRAVLRADGRETRGQGNASATITAALAPAGEDATDVTVTTQLTVTGKVAQFGRGVLADVSAKLLDQFVACLESKVIAEETGSAGGAEAPGTAPAAEPAPGASSSSSSSTARPAEGQPAEPEPVDLLGTAGAPVAKRLGPILAALAGFVLLRRVRRRRRRRKAANG